MDSGTGKISESKLKENLDLAISAYISRVDGCPCGETGIKLVRGSDSEEFQKLSKSLLVFLKGSKKGKEALKLQEPALYAHFSDVWEVRNRHLVKGLPHNYIFFLRCCYSLECTHPRCKIPQCGTDSWFPGGPSLSLIPMPVPDPKRPWGNTNCSSCKEFCSGHYSSMMVNTADIKDGSVMMPPSVSLKKFFTNMANEETLTDECLQEIAEQTLLTVEEVRIWFDHLTEVARNRKRGAAKAAETRLKKKETQPLAVVCQEEVCQEECPQDQEEEVYRCGTCGIKESDSGLFWIACDICDTWYCAACECLHEEPDTEMYVCKKCR